jgi:hypothetical protein
MESQETSAKVQKQGDPQLGAVIETANPPLAHTDVPGTVAGIVSSTVGDGDPKPKRHASPERSADRRALRIEALTRRKRARGTDAT